LDVLNIHKEGESGVVREGRVDPVFDWHRHLIDWGGDGQGEQPGHRSAIILTDTEMVLVRVPIACVDGSLSVGIENLDKDTCFLDLHLPCALEVNRHWPIRSNIIGDEFVDLLLSHCEGFSLVTSVAKLSLRNCHILVKWDWSRRCGRGGRCRRILWLSLIIEEGKLNIGETSA